MLTSAKIFRDINDLSPLIELQKQLGKEVVFTNGCFDLLHRGHLDYLEKAKALGDKLIVGLNSDDSIKLLKGDARPINNWADRAWALAALHFIDYVVFFNEPTPLKLIEILTPDVLVKGADYQPEQVVGKQWVELHGGKLQLISFVEGYSTTKLIEKTQSKH